LSGAKKLEKGDLKSSGHVRGRVVVLLLQVRESDRAARRACVSGNLSGGRIYKRGERRREL